MPEKDNRTKPRYEPPILVPLGELATGAGDCTGGSNPGTGTACTSGAFAGGGCTAGPVAGSLTCNGGGTVV